MPVFGIVAAPATGKVWAGSFFQRPSKFTRIINRYLIHERKPNQLRIVMSKSHQTDTDKQFLEFLEKQPIPKMKKYNLKQKYITRVTNW